MPREYQESKRRNPRKTLHLPSLQLPCQPPFIRPAVASTVCFSRISDCTPAVVPLYTTRSPRSLFTLVSLYLPVAITQGGAIQLANNGTDGVQGLQTLTMTNAAAAQPGTTILQYAQTSDGQQILVPSNQVVVQGE